MPEPYRFFPGSKFHMQPVPEPDRFPPLSIPRSDTQETSSLLTKASYAEALKAMSPRAAKKSLDQIKLRRLKEYMKWWNKDAFGNIHDKVKLEEERYAEAERKFDVDPSVENTVQMAESQASLLKTLHMEELFWK
ncbi:uncharacterized protein LOC122010068 isoform X1 [Zingiber officinale]|uniref:uncharacterized protein LOC122010068 isoform X1 n=1 Tax=Zingiber officinale TaxID=94328 RepID=UPI001C4CDEAB|nr:uncharacterized protein LOC122010068 isoform X1 [Zingiber officinale]